MSASREDLKEIEGIGAKTADRIRWAVNEQTESYGAESELAI
jgi:ERCC4-type nuclease